MSLYYMPKFREKYPVIKQNDLIQLNDLNSISERIEKLKQLLEIPEEESSERQAACAKVYEILKTYYPDSSLLMFGSSVNGFGVKNCDLDLLFLPFPEYSNLDCASSEKCPIPDPASILSGETPRDVLLKFNEWAHHKFIRNILRHHKTAVKKCNFIISGSPSLKVYLSDSKIVCDLSVSNKFVVFNSELLQFYGKLDPRVKPLVLALGFWARSLGFIRRSFFSNYAFTVLVISFLQNTNPPILPSVQHLTKLSKVSRIVAGWETAFASDPHLIKKSKNMKSVGELLSDFFEYYWNFDFVQNIVCPYLGKPLSVTDVRNSQDTRMASFEMSSINIQDPFILSRNICKIEAPRTVFKLALHSAYQMLQENDKMKFNLLFDRSDYQTKLDLNYGRYMWGSPKVCFINLNYECMMKLRKSAASPHSWYQQASEAVFDVLQYGLLIECEITDKKAWDSEKARAGTKWGDKKRTASDNNMNGKTSSGSTPYPLELLISIQCILYTRTWVGRRNVTEITMKEEELDEFNDGALKTEHTLSRQLLAKNPAINSRVPLLCFKCDCYKHASPQIADIIVMLKPLTLSKEFYQVSSFLRSYIPKTVKKILTSD